MTLTGVGFILAAVMRTEVGDVSRFKRPEQLAAYAGVVPRVYESRGKRRYGQLRTEANHYLKWAFVEAANICCRLRRPPRHTSRLYERVAPRRGHPKALGAVARHLAEAAYWVLARKEEYAAARLVHGSVNAACTMSCQQARVSDCGSLPKHLRAPERAKK